MIELILYVFALVFFVCAAIGVPSSRFSLIGAGLACWVLAAHIIGAIAR